MFTLDQIHQAFSKVRSGADFPQYVQDLKSLGITHYDNAVADGSRRYFGQEGFFLDEASNYPELPVSNLGSATGLKTALQIHQQGQTDYLEFCQQAAEAGVAKWTTHALEMTVTYFDKQGQILVLEQIPQP